VDVRPPIGLIGFAAEEWSRLIPILTAEGLLSRLDRTLLASFCLAWGRLCSAQAALDDGGGLTTTDGKGVTRPRVEVKIAAEATSAMAKLAADLGLTRSARGRLGLSVAVNPPDAPPARRAQRHDGIFDPEVDKDFS
jgi:P27 family predicted phage terminase small subunit